MAKRNVVVVEEIRFEVKRVGRTWSVFADGDLVEGGFFSRDTAWDCMEEKIAAVRAEAQKAVR